MITALYSDDEGNLWIGTNQGGLNRLRDGKITAYPPEKSGLPESIYAILEDARRQSLAELEDRDLQRLEAAN